MVFEGFVNDRKCVYLTSDFENDHKTDLKIYTIVKRYKVNGKLYDNG